MNPIQKGWVRLLKPFMNFYNERLARRPGIVGRFFGFFRFGPREYGVHTSTRFFRYINSRILSVMLEFLPQYSYLKHASQRGLWITDITFPFAWLNLFVGVSLLFFPFEAKTNDHKFIK